MDFTEAEQSGPALLRRRYVAELLGLSEYQVQKLIEAGDLPSTKVGAVTYIPSESVREYVDGIRRPA